MKKTTKWRYKNTTLLILSLVALIFLADTAVAHALIKQIGSYGYLGAAITGIFFVSTFTVAPASVVLFHLAQEFNPILIALYAGAGAAIGDLLIFRFLKDRVFEELAPLFRKFGNSYVSSVFKTPYFAWLLPVLGAIIIASPFPDEIGIGLMGLSKIKFWQFMLLAFVLNAVGIFIVVSLASAL
ncbi:MAG: hypothetical protein A2664_01965 [Candidatus Taylorbacteria bacterium RIFCSPHIGHO2_01_FULL_46_22b]|uniref:Uncharacterized protein n=1 Tax=Candidatus Taylorbacteria bacterium RIFCSPHIGHO2_01_FULL_46_22b TaxID=1802301 RepID=A0A1G2M376_9BACT|nr:MAG: hypothetical protein A2664_01965 [Candidatus Taylorbacteria bacterium RIFCSPHIGHO2_01_FULL_46_22b]